MNETSARLLRLLSLLQSPRDWTGPQLAGELGVTTRTVRKDVERLRDLGYTIDATRGVIGGYRLGAGTAMPPLILDDEEAVAIAIGMGQAARSGVSGSGAAAARAVAKLEQTLPTRLRQRVLALREATTQVPPDSPLPESDPATIAALATARREHERLRIAYIRHDGATSRRIVEPHHLVTWGQRWYLIAWDESRTDWRTFRVDRIARVEPTGLMFTPREFPEDDVSAYIALNVSRAGWRHTATLAIAASAEAVLAAINPAVGTVEPIDEATCLLRTGADGLETIVVYTGLLGFEFRIVSAPGLAEALRTVTARYQRALNAAHQREGPTLPAAS